MRMWIVSRFSNVKSVLSTFIVLSLLCGLILLPRLVQADGATHFVSFAKSRGRTIDLNVYASQSITIQFDQALSRVSFAEPKVAEAVVVSTYQVVINGKGIGTTSVVVWSNNSPDTEEPVTFTIRVQSDIRPVIAQMSSLFPDEQIKIEQVGDRIVLSGIVSSPKIIETAMPLFEASGLKPVNLTQVAIGGQPAQVMLQVRVAEVNKRALRDVGASYGFFDSRFPGYLGTNQFHSPGGILPSGFPFLGLSDAVNLGIFNPAANIGSVIRALQQRNAFRSLAEPNIIAVNGEKASFLAGGEFPYPVVTPTSNGISVAIQFREFGVRLGFTPSIVDGNRIRLQLAPEVSQLDFVNALQLEGFRIPALIVRKAATTIELSDGQSFALAGLLSNDLTKVESKVPFLGDIPIIGTLFKSSSYIKNETELVFLCTPRLVKPLEPTEIPPLPGVESTPSQGLEGSFGHQMPATEPKQQQTLKTNSGQ